MYREMPHLTLPIVLVHGIFMRDDSRTSWGRIPLWLSEGGNAVFFAGTNACSPVEVNARILAATIERVCMQRGVEAVHLIGFSRGGIDARCCVEHFGRAGCIASITTLCTPHAGSFVARNGFAVLSDSAVRTVVRVAECWARALGDQYPDAYSVFCDLDPLSGGWEGELASTYCQSYALESARPCRISFMRPVEAVDVPNDGLVSVRSAAWGNYRGSFYPVNPIRATRLIDPVNTFSFDAKHKDMVDARRRRMRLAIRRPDGTAHDVGDLRDVWCLMLDDLKEAVE